MRLLWTTSDKVGAKLIRWGLKSDCSHFAVVFDEDEYGRGIVFHSTSNGIGIDWFKSFLKENVVIHALKPRVQLSLEAEERIYKDILDRHWDSEYDYKALSWWIIWGLLYRALGMVLPTRNRWQAPKDFLCTEVAPYILKGMGIEPPSFDYSMVSPHTLYNELQDNPNLLLDEWWAYEVNIAGRS